MHLNSTRLPRIIFLAALLIVFPFEFIGTSSCCATTTRGNLNLDNPCFSQCTRTELTSRQGCTATWYLDNAHPTVCPCSSQEQPVRSCRRVATYTKHRELRGFRLKTNSSLSICGSKSSKHCYLHDVTHFIPQIYFKFHLEVGNIYFYICSNGAISVVIHDNSLDLISMPQLTKYRVV